MALAMDRYKNIIEQSKLDERDREKKKGGGGGGRREKIGKCMMCVEQGHRD